MNRFFVSVFAFSTFSLLAACSSNSHVKEEKIGMPNPAATYCVDQKGTLEQRKDAKGNVAGYCHLKNGQVVEEWDFFRKSHQEQGKKVGMANPAATYCLEQKGTLEQRKDAKGNVTGYCHLKNGKVIGEWDFFRQNHKERIVGLANPAATYCIEQKGTLEPRKDAKGNVISYCHLEDGKVVEEWAFFRAAHKK